MRAVMESEWPQLAQKLPAGRWMRHCGLSSRRGGKPGDRGRQCAALRRMQHDYLRARPADLSATAGICHDATGACVARHDQENFCAPTHRGDTSPAGRGLPQRTPLPRPPVRDDRTDPSKKIRAFDGEVAIAVAQLYLVHVFQRSIPAGFLHCASRQQPRKLPCSNQRLRDLRGLARAGSNGVFGIGLLRPRLKHIIVDVSRSFVINSCTRKLRPQFNRGLVKWLL